MSALVRRGSEYHGRGLAALAEAFALGARVPLRTYHAIADAAQYGAEVDVAGSDRGGFVGVAWAHVEVGDPHFEAYDAPLRRAGLVRVTDEEGVPAWLYEFEVAPRRNPRKRFGVADARRVAKQLGVRLAAKRTRKSFTAADLAAGMNVELEHGRADRRTDVTHDDPVATAKIALAHLKERTDYYARLAEMERSPLRPNPRAGRKP